MDTQLRGFLDTVYLVLVAALWGLTNPLLKKTSKGIEDIKRQGKISQMAAEFLYLVSDWKYVSCFILNQTGSVVFYVTLANADLTLAVPITNSMTFIFTALSAHLLGEKHLNLQTLLGSALVACGVLLCVLGKVEKS